MKISEQNLVEEATGSTTMTHNNEKGSGDSFYGRRQDDGKGDPCDQCGYMDCVCQMGSPRGLS